MKRIVTPMLIILFTFMMLFSGCEDTGPSLGYIPAQYVGSYSGTWFTTDIDGNQVTTPPENHGTWSMTVDVYGLTDLSISSVDGSVSESPLAAVSGIESGGYLVASGNYMDQFYGEITSNGVSVSGTWGHIDLVDFTLMLSGTFTGTKN